MCKMQKLFKNAAVEFGKFAQIMYTLTSAAQIINPRGYYLGGCYWGVCPPFQSEKDFFDLVNTSKTPIFGEKKVKSSEPQ